MTNLTPHRIEFVGDDTIIIGFTNKDQIAYLELFDDGGISITYKDNTGKFIGIETTYSEAEDKLLEILNGF